MKFPRQLPDIRDEIRKLRDAVFDMNETEIETRLDILVGCLTEAIVDDQASGRR